MIPTRTGNSASLRAYRARASAWSGPDHLGLAQLRPPGRVDGQAELVVDPAGQRPAAPVVLEELAGRGQVDRLDRGARLLDEEFLEVVAAELELVAVVPRRTS